MAIPDASLSFRASGETRKQLEDIMRLFERDRSWVLRKCVSFFWTFLFDLEKLEQVIRDWQVLKGSKRHDAVTHQLKLNFNQHEKVTFFPRIWPSEVTE
jgi:hypothetical protein